jgi:hypothetical protein
MPVGSTAVLDAPSLNATLGANATSLKVGTDNLLVMHESLAPYTPQMMIDPINQGGLGLDMSLQDAETIKAALAEAQSVNTALEATIALKKCWGLGIG